MQVIGALEDRETRRERQPVTALGSSGLYCFEQNVCDERCATEEAQRNPRARVPKKRSDSQTSPPSSVGAETLDDRNAGSSATNQQRAVQRPTWFSGLL
jgi:hypothetical protein